MKVVLLGATGFSGKAVLYELLSQNHKVTALVRNPNTLKVTHANLNIQQGNALDEQSVNQVLQGQEAVIQCLGVGGKGTGKPTTFISEATKILVKAMQKQQVKRLIGMSNVGAGNSIAFQPWIFKKVILPYFMNWLKVIIDDKNRMEPIIMNSMLDWVIIRRPNIVEKPPKGQVTATLDGKKLKLSITNQDLAEFMVKQLKEDTFVNQAPCVSN